MAKTWDDRKSSIANYRVNTVHTNKTGYAKLQGLYAIEFARWEAGGPSPAGKPEKARIIEQGLDLMLQRVGIDPKKFLRDPDGIVKAKIDEIKAAAGAS